MNILKSFLVITASLLSTSVFAGATFNNEVSVSDTYIYGSLASADKSSDNVQYVGCYINSYDTGAAVVCMGKSADGVIKTCTDSSPNEATLNAVSTISKSAYIYAAMDDGTCTRISIHANSAFIE